MAQPLRALLIDDDRDDYLLTRDLLTDAFGAGIALEWAKTYDDGLAALARREHDVCLLDYRLGPKTGLDLLREAAPYRSDVPMILLTGQGQREVDMEAMQAGAADFLTKDRLQADSLERAVRHALERHRDRIALSKLNEALESRVEQRTRELEEANQALQQADQRKDEFLAMLAHELRNPLAPISNSLELLARCDDDVQVRRQACDTMQRQLRQLVRLTEDLLEVSRISRGKIVLRKQAVDLQSVVRQSVEAARPAIDGRKQSLDVELPPAPIQLFADPSRLAQVIGNLLNNASKFTATDGRIELRVAYGEGAAAVSVRDDGIGIAPDQLDRIFEMFTQIDSSLERSEAGLGIGLTLVRKLVEMHGGTVVARSAGLGHGSEFIVTVPVESQVKSAGSAAPVVAEAPQPPSRKILIVDDNRDSVLSLSLLLKHSGHHVVTAFNGEDALRQAIESRPDVVLLDIGLPDLNGYEVARRLRQDPRGAALYLVALTGWGQESDRQRSKEAGFDHHLLKPVEFAALTKLLADMPRA